MRLEIEVDVDGVWIDADGNTTPIKDMPSPLLLKRFQSVVRRMTQTHNRMVKFERQSLPERVIRERKRFEVLGGLYLQLLCQIDARELEPIQKFQTNYTLELC